MEIASGLLHIGKFTFKAALCFRNRKRPEDWGWVQGVDEGTEMAAEGGKEAIIRLLMKLQKKLQSGGRVLHP